jgi:hypothetical protein
MAPPLRQWARALPRAAGAPRPAAWPGTLPETAATRVPRRALGGGQPPSAAAEEAEAGSRASGARGVMGRMKKGPLALCFGALVAAGATLYQYRQQQAGEATLLEWLPAPGMGNAREVLATKFQDQPDGTPRPHIKEDQWAPRTPGAVQHVKDVLFGGPGRRVLIGPSGSGKTSTVQRVAREADRDGIVFVNLKGATPAAAVAAFAAAFRVDADKADETIPRAIEQYHRETGRFAVVIVDDAQDALMGGWNPFQLKALLASLSKCIDAGALNMVFLTSQGGLPGKLDWIDGWRDGVEEHELDPIDGAAVEKHLQEAWKLGQSTAREIVDKVGAGTRDVFDVVLEGYKPSDNIDEKAVRKRADDVVAREGKRIGETLATLPHCDVHRDAASRRVRHLQQDEANRSVRRAAVLLLDRLTAVPRTSVTAVPRTSAYETAPSTGTGGWHLAPDLANFEHAAEVLVKDNILRTVGRDVAWDHRAVETAYKSIKSNYEVLRQVRRVSASSAGT